MQHNMILTEIFQVFNLCLFAYFIISATRFDLYRVANPNTWYLRSPVLFGILLYILLPIFATNNILQEGIWGGFLIMKMWSISISLMILTVITYKNIKETLKVAQIRTIALHFMIGINIMEAVFLELRFQNGFYNYLNAITGLLLTLNLYFNYRRKKLSYIDTNLPYPIGTQLNANLSNKWVLSYCLWNTAFLYSYNPSQTSLLWTTMTVLLPLALHLTKRLDFIVHRANLLLAYILIWCGFAHEILGFYLEEGNPLGPANFSLVAKDSISRSILTILAFLLVSYNIKQIGKSRLKELMNDRFF